MRKMWWWKAETPLAHLPGTVNRADYCWSEKIYRRCTLGDVVVVRWAMSSLYVRRCCRCTLGDIVVVRWAMLSLYFERCCRCTLGNVVVVRWAMLSLYIRWARGTDHSRIETKESNTQFHPLKHWEIYGNLHCVKFSNSPETSSPHAITSPYLSHTK
jgi:hypothetical protein